MAIATHPHMAERDGYTRLMFRRVAVTLGALLGLTAGTVIDILVGPSFLAVGDVLAALVNADGRADTMAGVIVHDIRLPMTLTGIVVGASLGVGGALMQTILGNPLASPYTLGFSAAAGFGAALAILTGFTLPVLPAFSVPVAAFAAATLSAMLVLGLARVKGLKAETMILAGIATLFLFQSLQSLVQYMAAPEVLQEIVFWTFGSLLKADWTSVWVSGAILAAGLCLLLPDIWRLTALRLGDQRATSLGVNTERLRLRSFAIVSLLTAGAVSFVGTVGFIGLVAPHVARMLVGEDQRALLPLSAIVGAALMIGASIASKLIAPGAVVPIGIVTAVVGVPFLLGIIVTQRRTFW
ncbi:iron ABC transporter permease [Nisaea acidiphila]|uniref:Iron ABC transporter permease n=1 Tax=Nisaea acidiphila TaxID=1862145 RepID=A0A9J7APP7_9PROT|nr:iron ABC transporter permease [Nisaea acidiphila]UUX48569.1 iron ABC transporter permease [Nisaea acidiphila]